MDSVITQHSCLQTLLIFSDLKDYFIFLKNELFFLNESVYGEEFVIILKGKKEGFEIKYYESGEKKYEMNWKDDKREGLTVGYYESGKKNYEANWKNDEVEGLTTWYYESGKKEREINYKDGKLEIFGVKYSESGEKR